MREAYVYMHETLAGVLTERSPTSYQFEYLHEYKGPPISLTMPVAKKKFSFEQFPPFFDGLLPEGEMLTALLKRHKMDEDDYFSQLLQTGCDLIGAVTLKEKA